MKSAICLTVKNEVGDITEWIAHHANIGVDQLIIYDDRSDDGTAEKLDRLSEHFPVTVVHWRTNESDRQYAAYRDCLKRFGAHFHWIGFIDSDEFLIPPPGARLSDLLERHKDHDAFAINWQVFGTSGIADSNGNPILETFTRRAESNFKDNHHVKSFVRPEKVQRVLNAHYFVGPENWADVMGHPIAWSETLGIVKEGSIVVGDWQLNHYVLRSDAHWQRRMLRGQANNNSKRDMSFVVHFDRNEVLDETALPSALRVRQVLREKGLMTPDPREKPILREEPLILPKPDNTENSIARNIRLHLDEMSSTSVRGWGQDDHNPNSPLQLRFLVDGKEQARIVCDQPRDDVEKAGFRKQSGFSFTLPAAIFDGNEHNLTVQTFEGHSVVIHQQNGALLELPFRDKWRPLIISNVDGFHGNTLRGWVLRKDDGGKWIGNSRLSITCNNVLVEHIFADKCRRDVAMAYKADAFCGFEYVMPLEFRATESQLFDIKVVPFEHNLTGSPLAHRFEKGSEHAVLVNDGYEGWAQKYLDVLRERTLSERVPDEIKGEKDPENKTEDKKIDFSIVCPVYNPDLKDFADAVDSVINQTHTNWELILVDDGSQNPRLTAIIDDYTLSDSRIKTITCEQNNGIARATNVGLSVANGDRIVFFDHDDLLVDVALEVMLKQANKTGALLLYSDEDKIDEDQVLSRPSLKPDWNYRMMLSANYLCHLIVVDRATLNQIGNLSSEYNGAQDHDMLLRLSEVIPPEKIKHVPEILYHWRMTATSTAGSTGAKPYAIAAGKQAIEDHLHRRGLSAEVTNIADKTWYNVNWQFTEEPSVSIIIPYKDKIEMTQECVDRVLNMTKYRNYEVILIDNGSTTDESVGFAHSIMRHPHVHVIRDDGPFNFSRLNNRAARASSADYYVLMNNDLHIREGQWLRTLVNEALADKDVGIVGGKFLYPDESVQHAGVVLGIGGVACHINGGIRENDPGYEGRALFAQELSAVTAACLLVDAKLYWNVGGLDEEHLAVAFNDVDLCLKVREAGRKVIWTPSFVAIHHESVSRGADSIDPVKQERFCREADYMQRRWNGALLADPNYHHLFDLNAHTAFSDLASPGRVPGQSTTLPRVHGASQWIHG